MTRLSQRDLRGALELVYDAGALTCPEPFPRAFLERLASLIPADVIVGYHEAVIGAPCRTVEVMEIPPDPVPAEVEEAVRQIFRQEPFLHGRYRSERRALKASDFMTRRRRRQTEWYATVWKPLGIDDSLRVWLPAPAGRARVINLERSGRNFTERERSLLEFLRPGLIKIHSAASARRRRSMAESQLLTRRETEILGWIARGRTSREIGAILFISPYTVRKHVEHILEKLEVSTRSAAVARFPELFTRRIAPLLAPALGGFPRRKQVADTASYRHGLSSWFVDTSRTQTTRCCWRLLLAEPGPGADSPRGDGRRSARAPASSPRRCSG